MEIVKNLSNLSKDFFYGLIIGNFDGVHKGHRSLLCDVKKNCTKRGEKFVVATFVPHPMVTLMNKSSFLINSYEERRELFMQEGVDVVVEFDFDKDFSIQSPEDFLDNYITSQVGLKVFYMGYDFTFGASKKGNYDFVKNHCISKRIQVKLLDEFKNGSQKINSSTVRNYLRDGDILLANKMLGRPFFITGKVKKGKGRGRKIGFLTANLDFNKDRLIPPRGVYATRVKYGREEYLSITNIGYNPTFENDEDLNIETNIFDFDKDIYDEVIQIQFFEKMRDEKKFDSTNDLIERIKIDCQKRRVLN